ncbi:DUF3862 domain-containing protein [Bacillus cereus group sp. BfR-BA-00331]|uniref:DUF3862 domain-containing protein n=1 Tax=Bacillus cereus group TaxID=86661 RepID=UPI000772C914|nr:MULTISPECIES: DUF3862 domain-containing protein [Bacillus cereus group]ONG68321.1 hypothetical protein BKK44_17735 [Bacillus cereus]MDA2196164.1 DUF3862 domain-containing protein [Bacillus cereus group sp. Bc238]MDA2201870.1 DUF3862 domain-containing protein [Bacillus cereus group sp. Bc237]MDA2756911.1 DUF3862 domain-containing protein [Bacillus cereus group sp. Bc007]MDA2762581.1 DUF3862 domain-containing protein [Bacillus cereus group sp. Bc008]
MLKKLGVLVLGSAVALSLVACDDATKEASNEKKEEQKQEAKKENKESKKKVTAADVEAIKVGDSLTGAGGEKYEDVVAKFGEPDNKAESQAGDIKMIIASWTKNVNGDLGANFNVTFTEKDGQKLATSKAQMGMK